MRFLITLPLLLAAASAAALPAELEARQGCNFGACIRAMATAGVSCGATGLIGLATCAAGAAEFLQGDQKCAGCFTRPHDCSIAGDSCPDVGTSYASCLDFCAANVFTGGDKVQCPVFCINTCGC